MGIGGANEGLSEAQVWDRKSMDRAFVAALRGEDVRAIGKYQVYSDYRDNETVVFIHDPTGQSDHKYIFANTRSHTYIVAAPIVWTEFHRDIWKYVKNAAGADVCPDGGGYVRQLPDGELVVNSRSEQFGSGDHARAKKAFEDAVRSTVRRGGAH
jgi:hypothetical protein